MRHADPHLASRAWILHVLWHHRSKNVENIFHLLSSKSEDHQCKANGNNITAITAETHLNSMHGCALTNIFDAFLVDVYTDC